ncbi:MAG: hypothetical protein OEY29_09035 [Gammaproteobacteria bacterium]|nr:hypothetical protein [Gammaproteobacteria bacterium]
MTHNFFLNLISVLFPILSLILAFVPADFNHYLNSVIRWSYRRFGVTKENQREYILNTVALRAFGIIGLLFSLAMILLMFYKPSA